MVSVLVIDDEPGPRILLAMALRGADVQVETAATGGEGLRLAQAKSYDWIISDVRLPDTSGIALTHDLKQAQPGSQVVLISAVVSEDEVAGLPIAAFWRKPFDPLALRRFILGGGRSEDGNGNGNGHYGTSGRALLGRLRPPHLRA